MKFQCGVNKLRKICIENSDFGEGIFAQIPESGGDFKNPRGPGGVPEGIFKIPERAEGICRKIHEKNPNLVYIFLLQIYNLHTI